MSQGLIIASIWLCHCKSLTWKILPWLPLINLIACVLQLCVCLCTYVRTCVSVSMCGCVSVYVSVLVHSVWGWGHKYMPYPNLS